MREIVLDTETTGISVSDGHRIIEIGALELVNHIPTGKNLHLYINPERDIEEGAFAVHGISLEFLADKPVFADVAAEFMEFVGHYCNEIKHDVILMESNSVKYSLLNDFANELKIAIQDKEIYG